MRCSVASVGTPSPIRIDPFYVCLQRIVADAPEGVAASLDFFTAFLLIAPKGTIRSCII